MVSSSLVLSSRKGSWFPIPWSFPPGKGHGFQFHGPFLQERVMVSNSMVLSSRKGSWFPIPWSFPPGKGHGFQFDGPVLSYLLLRAFFFIHLCRHSLPIRQSAKPSVV